MGAQQGSSPRQCREAMLSPQTHPVPREEKDWVVPQCHPLPCQHCPAHGHNENIKRKKRGKREEEEKRKGAGTTPMPSVGPPPAVVKPQGHLEPSLRADGAEVTSASGRCTAERAWMVLRSCSSLATSSFWPDSVAAASVSWICSSAQRTAKQNQGCHQGDSRKGQRAPTGAPKPACGQRP